MIGFGIDLAQPADRRVVHGVAEFPDEPAVECMPLFQSLAEHLDELLRADPAGNAFAARLVAEEFDAIEGLLGHIAPIAVDDAGRPEHQVRKWLEQIGIERQIEDVERRRFRRQNLPLPLNRR